MKKRSSRIFLLVLSAMMVCTIGGAVTASASNWQDTREIIYFSGNGDVIKTQSREKTDTSPMYLFNLPKSGNVLSRNESIATATNSPKFAYEGGVVCTATKNTYLAVGQKKYISSYVKERGYNWCNFEMYPQNKLPSTIQVKWSPDSIGAG